MTTETISTARRWMMLGIALFATLSANVFINGVAFLIPTLHSTMGLDLARAGLVSAMPSFGMVLTLIAWGYLVDRVGERLVLTGAARRRAGPFVPLLAVAAAQPRVRERRLAGPVGQRPGDSRRDDPTPCAADLPQASRTADTPGPFS